MKHLITLAFLLGAGASYFAGSASGAAVFVVLGVLLEIIFWARLLGGKKRGGEL